MPIGGRASHGSTNVFFARPLLKARLAGEARQVERIRNGLAKKTFVLPWLARPPIGIEALSRLVTKPV